MSYYLAWQLQICRLRRTLVPVFDFVGMQTKKFFPRSPCLVFVSITKSSQKYLNFYVFAFRSRKKMTRAKHALSDVEGTQRRQGQKIRSTKRVLSHVEGSEIRNNFE
jgi:hypothetical protein